MGKSNKRAKQALIEIYGDGCMFEKARIAEKIEQMGGIRTYRSYVAEKRFKGKSIKKQLTYHHLRHKSDGGPATVENGAVVDAVAHAYLHSLPRHQEEIINNMLRLYKINFVEMTTEGVVQHDALEFDLSDYVTIPLYNDNERYNRKKAIEQRKKGERLSRAQVKRETRRKIDEYYEGECYDGEEIEL